MARHGLVTATVPRRRNRARPMWGAPSRRSDAVCRAGLNGDLPRLTTPHGRGCTRLDRIVSFTLMAEVKKRRRGTSRLSSKHQVTIPADALRAAGLEVGERLVFHAEGPGRVVLEREADVLDEYAGALTGIYEPNELGRLRDEWD